MKLDDAAKSLEISSNMVNKWRKLGLFPNSTQNSNEEWEFSSEDVLAVRDRIKEIEEKNKSGDLIPPDIGDDDGKFYV